MSSNQPVNPDDNKRVQRRRRMIALAIFAMSTGLMAFSRVAGNPRFETIHTIDVLGLMTAGAGCAVAIVVLMQSIFTPGR